MEKTEKPKSNKKKIVVGAIISGIGIGVYFFLNGEKIKTTDNAQIEGDIISLRSSVTAYVDEIRFKDNQQVNKGDTLIIFNTTVLSAKVAQAKATLANAEAAVKVNSGRASASVENANASLQTIISNQQAINVAKANLDQAQDELERTRKLFDIKGATKQQLEAALSKVTVTKAQYEEALSREQSSMAAAKGQGAVAASDKAQISTAEALVEQREAELAIAQEDLNHAIVVAPCNGTVTKRAIQIGQYVLTGQSLCSLVDEENFWVSANIKETQLQGIGIGQKVEISVDAFPDLILTGKVESFGGATGAKFSLIPPDNASGNFVKVVQRFPLRISIDNDNTSGKTNLYPGLSAFVKIIIN